MWYDSITKTKKVSTQPLLEVYSSLYNYAVCIARIACYMDLEGDGIKSASKHFQQAAWVFEQLLTMVGNLPPAEISVDFSKEALTMNINLCLAQAQYLFFRKGKETEMKPNVLAKIVAQVSVYFQKAFEQSQVNKNVRTFDQGKFAAVLGYQAKYFIALAYNVQAEAEYKVANEKSKGIGKAITVLKITVDKYIEA